MSAIMTEVCMEDGVVRLEPRVARIEADVASLKQKVDRLDEKVDRLDEKVDERFERVDERFERVDERFAQLDGKINDLDKRMTVMAHGFDNMVVNQSRLHIDLRDLRGSLDTKFVWIVTTMIAFGSAVLYAMAKGFHWLR